MISFYLYIIVMFSSYLPGVFYFSGPILSAVYIMQSNSIFFFKRNWFVAFCFFVTIFLSFLCYNLLKNFGTLVSIKGFVRFSTYLLIVPIVRSLSRDNIHRLFEIMSLTIVLVMPFFQLFMYDDYQAQTLRYQFIFLHPNHFAYFLLTLIIYNLSLGNKKSFNSFCLFFLVISLLLTKSSGGLMACLMALAVHYVTKKKRIVYSLLGIFAIILLANNLGFFNKIYGQACGLFETDLESKILERSFGGAGSLTWRFVYWTAIILSYIDGSVVEKMFGYGFGSMSLGSYCFDFMYTDPHNDYIRILCETGLVGFGVFVFGLSLLCRKELIRISFVVPLLLFPMFFGNVIVNPSFLICAIMLMVLDYKQNQGKLL